MTGAIELPLPHGTPAPAEAPDLPAPVPSTKEAASTGSPGRSAGVLVIALLLLAAGLGGSWSMATAPASDAPQLSTVGSHPASQPGVASPVSSPPAAGPSLGSSTQLGSPNPAKGVSLGTNQWFRVP